jgi:gliding motility-associated-like protein
MATGLQKMNGQCPITVDAGLDISVCAFPASTQLNANIFGDYLGFSWTPVTADSTLETFVSPTQPTSYVLSATAADLDHNLVVNGNFEQGNIGFNSEYGYSPYDLFPEGLYDIGYNPQDDHPAFSPCFDHTSGTGKMMIVNGAGDADKNVWCQKVTVVPNKEYVLSAWVTSVFAGFPGILQFSINGATVGPLFVAPQLVCSWDNYFQVWNSGSSTSATICIVNQNFILGGNDFALDDIVFAPVCTVVDTIQLAEVSITAVAPNVVVLPCQGASVTLSGTGSTTGPNVSYAWATANGHMVSGENTLNPVVDAPGIYTLRVLRPSSDGTICEKTASVQVVPSTSPLVVSIDPPAPLGCSYSTTSLTGHSNQPGFEQYAWGTTDGLIVSGENQMNCVVSQGGSYFVTVTNTSTGCTASASVAVTANTTPPLAFAQVADTLTCNRDTAVILSAGSSTGANISYAWKNTGGQVFGTDATFVVDTAGVYVLHVTNTNTNCVGLDTVTVVENKAHPYLELPTAQQITCRFDTIQLTIDIGPSPILLVQWTATAGGHFVAGSDTPNPLVDTGGTYAVAVEDPSNGCVSTGVVVVTTNMNHPVASIAAHGAVTCQSPIVTLSGSGSSSGAPFGYAWTTANGGNIVSGENSLEVSVNWAGNYTLTILDSLNGCFVSASTQVMTDTNAVHTIANAPDTLTCNLLLSQLNADGSAVGMNYTHTWTTTTGHIVSGADTPMPSIDQPGSYQLLLTNNDNGCFGIDLAVVMQDIVSPQITATPPIPLTCYQPTQILVFQNNTPTGNFFYAWTTSFGGQIDALTPTIDTAGMYILTTTNLTNGCTSIDSFPVVMDMGTPTVDAGLPGLLTCAQTALVLDGSASSAGQVFAYHWSALSGGSIVGDVTGNTAIVETPGTYILHVTDIANGCFDHDTVEIKQDIAIPMADAGLPDTITCNTPRITLLANGPNPPATLSYHWDTPAGPHPLDIAKIDVTAPGVYTLTVTNPFNGCFASDSVAINAIAMPSFQPTPTQPTCHIQYGTVEIGTINGGVAPFQYSLDGGQTFDNKSYFNKLSPGTYSLVVRDGIGCTSVETATIDPLFIPTVSIPKVDTLFLGDSILLEPVTNILPYNVQSWQWSPSDGLSCSDCAHPWAAPFRSKIYTLTVLDNNDCPAESEVRVLVHRRRILYAPNVFSPNFDGENDFFAIFGRGIKEIERLQVFDRWGNQLFVGKHLQAGDEQSGWDGTFQGRLMDPAVYVWVSSVVFIDGEVELFHGDILLVR